MRHADRPPNVRHAIHRTFRSGQRVAGVDLRYLQTTLVEITPEPHLIHIERQRGIVAESLDKVLSIDEAELDVCELVLDSAGDGLLERAAQWTPVVRVHAELN